MRGLHLTADLFDCRDRAGLLSDSVRASAMCEQLVAEVGLSAVARSFHSFAQGPDGAAGWTGVLLLAESHVALHTWPEQQAVTIDVFVCNVGSDNSAKAGALLDRLVGLFEPQRLQRQQLERGRDALP
jgi:S-adenosylmethionine decarboxylase proenzyme